MEAIAPHRSTSAAFVPHQQRQRRRRSSMSKELAQGNRKIYDPRSWQKKTHSGSDRGGQPPAGWVLIWTGRFKRWQRRWFVANPPGLLLHYKNSETVGRHGCISLLGATVVPTSGKERQFKIMKGSDVYYLRTISRDYRQPWLDAIHESIRVYHDSVQRAGRDAGIALLPQPSVPSHEREDWEDQEREFNRRVRERLKDLEPTRQAFLDQLQTLQQSLSTISGVLGFAEHSEGPVNPTTTNGLSTSPKLPETNWRSNGLFMMEDEAPESDAVQQQTVTPATGDDKLSSPGMGATKPFQNYSGPMSPWMLRVHENDHENINGSRSLLKMKSDAEAFLPKEPTQDISGIRSQNSVPIFNSRVEKKFERGRRRSLSVSLDDHDPEFFSKDVSCIGAECFSGRKRSVHGNSSDPESGSKKQPISFSGPLHHRKRNGDSAHGIASTSSEESDPSLMKKLDRDVMVQRKETDGSSHGSTSRTGGASSHGSKEDKFGVGQLKAFDKEASTGPGRNGLFSQGPLHAAWNNMQDTYNEALKEEICRVLELEADNAVLQQALRSLRQLHHDRAAHSSMRERCKEEKQCECEHKNTSEESVTEDGEDTEDDIAIVHPDVGNEV